MPHIRLNSSALAALVGRNPYVSRADAVLTAWRSSDRESYLEAHTRLGLETPEQRKDRIRAMYPEIDTIARTTKPSLLSSALPKGSMFLDDPAYPTQGYATKTPPITYRDVMETARETAYTQHGIDRETIVLDAVNRVMGTQFEADDTLWTREIGTTRMGTPVTIQGRVDAIDATSKTILEIKTRARGLFMRLKDYERVQIESYLFLTGYTTAFLAEAFFPSRQSTEPDLNINRVDRDDDSIQALVDETMSMAEAVDRVVNDPHAQDLFLQSQHRGTMVSHWIDTIST